jgi:hypothetical protein
MSRQVLIDEAADEIEDLCVNSDRKLTKAASKFFIANAIDVYKGADIVKPESKYISDLNDIMSKYFANYNKSPTIDSAYWLKLITTGTGKYLEKVAKIESDLIDIEAKLKLEINGTRTISTLMKKKKEDLLNEIRPKGETVDSMKWRVELYTEYMKYIGGRSIIEQNRRRKQNLNEIADEMDAENNNINSRKRSLSSGKSDSSPRGEAKSNKKKSKSNRKEDFEAGLKEKTDELARNVKEKDDSMKELINVIKTADNSNNLVMQIQEQQLQFWKLRVAKMEKEMKENSNNNNNSN